MSILSGAANELLDGGTSAARTIDLRELWRGLLAGRLFIAGSASMRDRAFVTVDAAPRSAPAAFTPDDVMILERALRGERQKVLALELGLCPSRITNACITVLEAIGNERSVTNVSIVLVMATLAAGGLAVGRARVDGFSHEDRDRWVLSVDDPSYTLRPHLSGAEYAVARLVVEGVPHEEILRRRNASSRTVSNQLASVFRKLGISGRRELRARAVHEHALRIEAATSDDAAVHTRSPFVERARRGAELASAFALRCGSGP